MQQNSRLNIVVDTTNAETHLARFTQKLLLAESASKATAKAINELNKAASGKKGLANLATVLANPTRAIQAMGNQLSGLTFTLTSTATAAGRLSPVLTTLATATARITPAIAATTAQLNTLTFSLASSTAAAGRLSPIMGAAAAATGSIAPVAASTALQLGALTFTLAGTTAAAVRMSPVMGAAAAAAAALVPAAATATVQLGTLTFSLASAATTALRLTPAMGAAAAAAARIVPTAGAATVALNRLTFSLASAATAAARLSPLLIAAAASTARIAPAANAAAAATTRAAASSALLGRTWVRSNNTARSLIGSLYDIKNVASTIVFAAGGFGILKIADDMQNLNTQVKLVTNGQAEYAAVMQQVKKIADKNFNSIDATVSLYQKSARALSNLGKSQQETLTFTNAVSLAMRTGGRSAGEQAAAILQLGQAMGSGVLMGDEFRSISENAPILLELVSKQLGVLPGQLKKMASEGEITSEVMYEAFSRNVAILEELAAQIPLSMGQALTTAKNQFKYYVDDLLNTTGGVSSSIASMIQSIGDNFGTIVKVLAGGVLLLLSKFATGLITSAIAANGLGLAALRVTGATAASTLAFGAASNVLLTHSRLMGVVAGIQSRALTVATLGVRGSFVAAATSIQASVVALGRWNAVAGVSTAVATRLAGSVAIVTGAFVRLATVINAHPLMFLATVVFAIVASVEGLDGAMTSLGDVFGITGIILSNFIGMGVEGFSSLANASASFISSFFENSKKGTEGAGANFNIFFEGTEKGFVGLAQGIANIFDAAALTIYSFVQKIANTIENLVIRARNAGNSMRGLFGFSTQPEQQLKETGFSSLMDANSGTFFGGGLGSIFSQATGDYRYKQAQKNIDLSGDIGTGPMSPEKAAQYKLFKANEALAAAREEEAKQAKKDAKGAKKRAKDADKVGTVVNAKVLAQAKLYDYASIEKRYGLDAGVLAAVSMQESRGKENARSPAGAKGAFQFMPATAKRFKIQGQEYNVAKSAEAAAQYLSWLLKRFGSMDLALAGYNAGEGNVDKYKGIPPFKETQKYVPAVNGYLRYMQGGVDGSTNINGILSAEMDAVRDAEKELARVQKEAADKRIAIQNEYGQETLKIDAALVLKLQEIQSAGYSDEQTKYYSGIAITRATNDKAIYQKALDDKLLDLKEYTFNERDILQRARDNELFAANTSPDLTRPETQELLKANIDAINAKYDYDLVMLNKTLGKELNAIQAYKRTERQIIEDNWDYEISIATSSYGLLAEARADAAKEQKTKELAEFDLNQDYKLLDINRVHITEMQYIREKYALDQELNRLSNMSPEFKDAQSQSNTRTMGDAANAIREKAREAYGKQTNNLYGIDNRNSDLLAEAQTQRQIAQDALDAEEIDAQEHFDRMIALNAQYLSDKKALMAIGYGEAWGVASQAMKLFGGEQSKAYRTMFYIEKGYALQSAILKQKLAIMDAWATPGNYFTKAMAVGKVLLSTGLVSQALSAVEPRGFMSGGYTGNVGAKNVAGVVHGNEYVFDAQSTKAIGVNNLEAMRSGKAIGGTNVNINVAVNANGGSQMSGDTADNMGRKMAQGMKQVALDVIRQERRQGGMLYA